MVRFNVGRKTDYKQIHRIKVQNKKKAKGNPEKKEHEKQVAKVAGGRTSKNVRKNNKVEHKAKMLKRAAKRGQTHKLEKVIRQAEGLQEPPAPEAVMEAVHEVKMMDSKKANRRKKAKAVAMEE